MASMVGKSGEEQVICSDVIFLRLDLEMDHHTSVYTPLVTTSHMVRPTWKGS